MPPNSLSPQPELHPSIQQEIGGDRNQAIGQVCGGMVVYVSGGQAIINPATVERAAPNIAIGPSPYRGLLAFHEGDRAQFFGRSREIQTLWALFRELQTAAVRLLPVYGPSGCGKSSLVRAGLIPELGQHPLPGCDRARVAVLIPGTQPLQALAAVLARIAENDPTPVKKTREFAEELALTNRNGQADGLHRIATVLPEIGMLPLIVLVDQFEEVYSLCPDASEREHFIANLLHAASNPARYVSVILTLRSDFLAETQQHPNLNRLFSTQGFLVPAMDPDGLRSAIVQPAEQAGHPLDTGTVNLLIEQTEGREGALPLLQFALTQIWAGLHHQIAPATTLAQIGGVGGALAGEAQRIYDCLSPAEQQIARRVFLKLVQPGIQYSRRRTRVANLVSPSDTPVQLRQVLNHFSAVGTRLITLSAQPDGETAEVTHEALFEHWQLLQTWLAENRLFLAWQERLQVMLRQWELGNQEPDALLRGAALGEAEVWLQKQAADLSQHEQAYIQASLAERDRQQAAENQRQQREYDLLKQFVRTARIRTRLALTAAGLAIVALGAGGAAWYQQQQAQQAQQAFLLGIEPANPVLLRKLPDFLKQADQLGATGKEEKIQLALAYYRKMLTDTQALLLAIETTPAQFQPQDEGQIRRIAQQAEAGLVTTIRQARLPQLQVELEQKKFGRANHQFSTTELESRYTGALQTTARILMSNFGAQADLNGNGQIDNPQEADRLPCETLKAIETLWRQATNQRCGWYGKTDEYQSPECDELQGGSLLQTIFVNPYSEVIKQLNRCPGIAKLTQNHRQN